MLYRLGWKFGYSLSKLMQAPRKNRIKAESDRIERLAVEMLLDKSKVPENITSLPDQMKEQCGGGRLGDTAGNDASPAGAFATTQRVSRQIRCLGRSLCHLRAALRGAPEGCVISRVLFGVGARRIS